MFAQSYYYPTNPDDGLLHTIGFGSAKKNFYSVCLLYPEHGVSWVLRGVMT
jgi:hypothetical protein